MKYHHLYKIAISRGSKTQNHSKKAISSELSIQTYEISANTLYLVNESNLTPFQTSFVVISSFKIQNNVTICKKLTFQEDQKHKIIQNKQ